MTKQAMALLETALRERKLDRTLTTALPALDRTDAGACVATDMAALDTCLHGGLPRGQLSEIAGARSSGRTTVFLQVLAAVTARGEIAAVIDTFDRFDVASAVAAHIDLDRVLWIRGHQSSLPLVERTIDRALKALNLVLTAGGFGIVVLDLADIRPRDLARVPFTTWLRVQRTIEGSDTACLLVVPQPVARSAGGLTLTVSAQTMWTGNADRGHRMAGLDVTVGVISPRRRVDGHVVIGAHVHECARV